MTVIEPTDRLGDVVTDRPDAARVLEHFGLDYCCGGAASLGDACRDLGLEPDDVIATIDAEGNRPREAWADMTPTALVDHLETTHHPYLHEELPRLAALAEKVEGVHGERHPELTAVRVLVAALHADLEPHMAKEEQVLFPMVRELMAAETAPRFHCGSLANPISVMLAEHDHVGALLTKVRAATAEYDTPPDGCASYRALYSGLKVLETDTHLHVHKENNLLFPAVVARERELLAQSHAG